MKNAVIISSWITAKDANFEKQGPGRAVGKNVSFPKDTEAFIKESRKKGLRFAVELTLDLDLLCAVVPDGITPSEALKNGTGLVWGITDDMAIEYEGIFHKIVEDYNLVAIAGYDG